MTTTTTRNQPDGEAASAAIARFTDLQAKLLDYYGVRATSRLVQLARPAMRAHVLEAGEGEPIIFVHGGDGEAVNWSPLLAVLQDHAHVYAVDRPGFGLSDAFDYRTVDLRTHASDFMESLLDALGLETATLVGGSMGGFFVLNAAIAHPERVHRVVLVGYAVGTTRDVGGMAKICGTPGAAEAFMTGRDTMEAQKSQYRDMFQTDPTIVPELFFETRIAGLRLPSEQGTWATLLPRLATLEGLRPEIYLGDELPSIQAPTLVMWGENDLTAAAAGAAVATQIPGGRFAYLEGVGHFPFLEVPELTADHILEFVRET
ncbi:MAG: alpha/beta hydrolase [Dehalococcoidia bacterium]|nr:alpha/beta hydrolase [Dehalococcoidia bacterium]